MIASFIVELQRLFKRPIIISHFFYAKTQGAYEAIGDGCIAFSSQINSTSQIQRKKTVRKRLPACCDCAAPKGCFSPAKSLKPHLVACPACRFSLAYLNANGNEPTARLTLLPLVPAAFFGVHGKDKHKDVEGVSRICYIKNIGIGKIEKLFTNARNAISVPIAEWL